MLGLAMTNQHAGSFMTPVVLYFPITMFAPCRAQEELEARLEKFSTRRLPLGLDRHFRRYWWGLAGQKAAVWVEGEQVGEMGEACSGTSGTGGRGCGRLSEVCPMSALKWLYLGALVGTS